MKKLLGLLVVTTASFGLFACNAGDDGSTIANISTSNSTCATTIARNATCQITVTYSAPAGSPILENNTLLQLSGLNGYPSNILTQCTGVFSTTAKSCIITITNQSATVGVAQTGSLYPSGYSGANVTFPVGGV